MQNADQTLDARGMNCPLPILRTRKALTGMASGQTLKVLATDPGSVKDMQSFCEQTGHTLEASNQQAEDFSFLIRKP